MLDNVIIVVWLCLILDSVMCEPLFSTARSVGQDGHRGEFVGFERTAGTYLLYVLYSMYGTYLYVRYLYHWHDSSLSLSSLSSSRERSLFTHQLTRQPTQQQQYDACMCDDGDDGNSMTRGVISRMRRLLRPFNQVVRVHSWVQKPTKVHTKVQERPGSQKVHSSHQGMWGS